jgi:tetratricopeptide (TPR) repeat protein
MALHEKLARRQDEFHDLALPHVCSFMPHPQIDFETTVHFAIGTDFSGFAADNFIVISISDPYWASDDSAILNAMLHEVFHIAYGWNSFLRSEAPLADRFLGDMLQQLQNEGMATYVAYKATSFFSAPSEKDFSKLEDEVEVLASLDRLSKLFEQAERQQLPEDGPAWMPDWLAGLLGYESRMTPEELRRELWRVGVEQRAYYVGGAYMAKTIDERLGRDALIATVAEGPRSFVRVYNSLVDGRRRIHEFQTDEDRSTGQALRSAALADDPGQFKRLLSRIRRDPPDEDRIQWFLWSAANALRLRGRLDLAVETYETLLQFNPESADAFDGLGLIHLQQHEKDLALLCFRKSAALEPHRPLAFKMVRDLEGYSLP